MVESLQYHLPQYATNPCLFHKGESFDAMIATAKEFLERTQSYWMNLHAIAFTNNYDWENVSEAFACFGEEVSAQTLKDEWWSFVDNFIKSNTDADGVVKSGYHKLYTPHFNIDFDTELEKTDIETECVLRKWHYTTNESDKHKAIDLLFEMALNEPKDSMISCVEMLHNEKIDDVPTHLLTTEGINDVFTGLLTEYHEESRFNRVDEVAISTGCFRVALNSIKDGSGTYSLDVYLEMCSACEIREERLWNLRTCIIDMPSY